MALKDVDGSPPWRQPGFIRQGRELRWSVTIVIGNMREVKLWMDRGRIAPKPTNAGNWGIWRNPLPVGVCGQKYPDLIYIASLLQLCPPVIFKSGFYRGS